MNEPVVSFVMPTIGEQFIDKAVGSILDQRLINIELIIVDSNENRDLSRFTEDKRVRLFKREELSSTAAYNFGVTQARGEYICPTADDDASVAERALLTAAYMDGYGLDFFYGSSLYINHEDVLVELIEAGPYDYEQQKHGHSKLCFGTTAIRKNKFIPLLEDLWLLNDMLMYVEAYRRSYKFGFTRSVLAYTRYNMTSISRADGNAEERERQIKRAREMLGDNEFKDRHYPWTRLVQVIF